MERIDVRGDMLTLIDSNRNCLSDKESPWISNIFNDIHLSHFSELPLPPTNKPLTTNLSHHPAWLDKFSLNEFSQMILLQRQPEIHEQDEGEGEEDQRLILENIQGLGVYDGLADGKNEKKNEKKP